MKDKEHRSFSVDGVFRDKRSPAFPSWTPGFLKDLYCSYLNEFKWQDDTYEGLLRKMAFSPAFEDVWKRLGSFGQLYLHHVLRYFMSPTNKENRMSLKERNEYHRKIKVAAEALIKLLHDSKANSYLSMHTVSDDYVYLGKSSAKWFDNFAARTPIDVLKSLVCYVESPSPEAKYQKGSEPESFISAMVRAIISNYPDRRVPNKAIAVTASEIFGASITELDVNNVAKRVRKTAKGT